MEERKRSFDKVVQAYDRRRPRYVPELFDAISQFARLTPDSRLLEVGCGTGQATEPFLNRGCSVTAVELGKNMAAYVKEKFRNFPNFHVFNQPFEEFAGEEGGYDLLYSATAFHWIAPETGYPKALRLLKPGGTLALFWTRPTLAPNQPLTREINALYAGKYARYFPPDEAKKPESRGRLFEKIQREIECFGFTELSFQLFHGTRVMTGREYAELLDTYSDHRTLEEPVKREFYHAVQSAIESHGDRLELLDTMDLYLARKP